uniref:Ig-like domain-containing protein n=1 Tax=Stegastes partitus TaxID=144197 RepID=A0A3B5A5C2_9TELE
YGRKENTSSVYLWLHPPMFNSTNEIVPVIKPISTEQVVAEGRNIRLTCDYDGTIYSIQWYRQYQRSRPEFLLSITEGGSIHPTLSDFSAHINKTHKRVDLEIISAAVTDSAVYYCALELASLPSSV